MTDLSGVSASEQTMGLSGSFGIPSATTASTISVTDGQDPNQFFGDGANDSPIDPTQTYDGNIIFWEIINTYSGSDGNTYTGVVFEYDANGSGGISISEESFFIGFIPNGFDPNNVTLASLGNGAGGLPPGTVPPPGVTLTRTSILANSPSLTIVCFDSNSLIRTPTGDVKVKDLAVGNLVETTNGPERIRWINSVSFTKSQLATNPKLRPVRIRAGALGPGLPRSDLVVSRQHRMLVSSRIAERIFGVSDVLVPAIKLTMLPGIYVDESVSEIEYWHFLLDNHGVVFAEGAPSESLYAGPEALKAMSDEARAEILSLFPELSDRTFKPHNAEMIPRGKRVNALVLRHEKNRVPLLEAFDHSTI